MSTTSSMSCGVVVCPQCGRRYRARSHKPGARARCSECGKTFALDRLPTSDAIRQVSPSPKHGDRLSVDTRPSAPTNGKPNIKSKRRSRVFFVIASGLLCACLVGAGLVIRSVTEARRENRQQGRAAMIRHVAEKLDAAHTEADEFRFTSAKATLDDLHTEVEDSQFVDVAAYDEITARIDSVRREIIKRQQDFQGKLRNGWVVFDGELMPATKREEILDAREKQRRVEAAERERLAAAQRRREAELARLEETRRAHEAIRQQLLADVQAYNRCEGKSLLLSPDWGVFVTIGACSLKDDVLTLRAYIDIPVDGVVGMRSAAGWSAAFSFSLASAAPVQRRPFQCGCCFARTPAAVPAYSEHRAIRGVRVCHEPHAGKYFLQ